MFSATFWTPDHPRACGANIFAVIVKYSRAGSSPRMRGKLTGHLGKLVRARIIPAHAGQTLPLCTCSRYRTDHPRACGANLKRCRRAAGYRGSSPRMRGKHMVGRNGRIAVRIIPAHAGQTVRMACTPLMPKDHPRACGANNGNRKRTGNPNGSSPRMRGKHWKDYHKGSTVRIIPAHAGQTGGCRIFSTRRTDHPRACGAN